MEVGSGVEWERWGIGSGDEWERDREMSGSRIGRLVGEKWRVGSGDECERGGE